MITAAITVIIDVINLAIIHHFDVCIYPAPMLGTLVAFMLAILSIIVGDTINDRRIGE